MPHPRLAFHSWPAAVYAIGDVHGCLDQLVAMERLIASDGLELEGEKWIVTKWMREREFAVLDVTSSPAPVQFCGCPGTSGVTSVTCGTSCPDGMSAGTYATVSATRTYTTLVPYPGFPNSYVQNASSTVRIQ